MAFAKSGKNKLNVAFLSGRLAAPWFSYRLGLLSKHPILWREISVVKLRVPYIAESVRLLVSCSVMQALGLYPPALLAARSDYLIGKSQCPICDQQCRS